MKPKLKSAAISPVDDVLLDEFLTLVARIVLRIINAPSKTVSNTTEVKKHKQIRLITVEDAARIPGIARSEVFQALCARQKGNTGKDILIPVERTERDIAGPITEI